MLCRIEGNRDIYLNTCTEPVKLIIFRLTYDHINTESTIILYRFVALSRYDTGKLTILPDPSVITINTTGSPLK